ncbi:MAG: hypothetical protein IT497_04285 [Ottowia sp.]|nr:hypothetical protein [Ottowia sp.]
MPTDKALYLDKVVEKFYMHGVLSRFCDQSFCYGNSKMRLLIARNSPLRMLLLGVLSIKMAR